MAPLVALSLSKQNNLDKVRVDLPFEHSEMFLDYWVKDNWFYVTQTLYLEENDTKDKEIVIWKQIHLGDYTRQDILDWLDGRNPLLAYFATATYHWYDRDKDLARTAYAPIKAGLPLLPQGSGTYDWETY